MDPTSGIDLTEPGNPSRRLQSGVCLNAPF